MSTTLYNQFCGKSSLGTPEISILHVNNNSFRGPLINGPRSGCSLNIRFIDDSQRKLWSETFFFKSSDHEFLTSHQVSVPKRTIRKWQITESKTERKTMWVKKVVVALGDS